MKVSTVVSENEAARFKKLGGRSRASGAAGKVSRRRQLSRQTMAQLQIRLAELRAYRERFGTFDVPRDGSFAELGDWVDKLKETYAKRPDGHRIRWLLSNAPDVVAHLAKWSKAKAHRTQVVNQPFWLSAAWALEFMGTKMAAPSQASFYPDEVALAKWLSRWTTEAAIERLRKSQSQVDVAIELDRLAQGLRSKKSEALRETRLGVATWLGGDLYLQIAKLAEQDSEWAADDRKLEFETKVKAGEKFWPSWSDWKRQSSFELLG